MALRTKTVQYVFPMATGSLAATTRRDLAAITLYIPENTSRTFRSAIFELSCDQVDTAATSLTSWLIGAKLGAAAFQDVTVTDTIANTAETSTWRFESRDFSAYFNTNFGAGTTQTFQVGFTLGAVQTINHVVIATITYEFDDSGQNVRTKTVWIPLDCSTAVLTNTLAEIGTTNQIPQLTGSGTPFLPESNPTIRNIYMVTEGNGAVTAVTDWLVGTQIDVATEVSTGNIEGATNSSMLHRHVWDLSTIDFSAAHAWKMRTTVTSRLCWQQCHIVCTYEYNHNNTTSFLNSRRFPFHMDGPLPTSANGEEQARIRFDVPEPGSVALRQSGFIAWVEANSANNITVAVGSQADRTYVQTLGSLNCGDYAFSHRFDASAAAGAGGLTLARGKNVLDIAAYVVNTIATGRLCGCVMLNYTSSLDADGGDAHTHSTCWSIWGTGVDSTSLIAPASASVVIPEASYSLQRVGVHQVVNMAPGGYGHSFDVRAEPGEGGHRWQRIFGTIGNGSGEEGVRNFLMDATDHFKKWPTQLTPDLLDVEVTHSWRDQTTTAYWHAAKQWVDYSAITYSVSGAFSGYETNGSNIVYHVFDPDNFFVVSGTTGAGGIFTASVYDDRSGYKVIARSSSLATGRSDDGTPT